MEGSEFERITVLMMRGYGDRMRSFSEVADLFNEDFPNRTNPITRFTVARIVQRFNDTQSVKDRPKLGRASSIDEEKLLDVMQSFVENQHLSTRRAALEHDISQSSVKRILKDIALRSNPSDLKKTPDEIMEQAAAKFGFLDKSEVNRFIRLQRRSPSPFPREAIKNKCSCCYNNIEESSRQLCLRNMWAVSDNNGNSSSGSFHTQDKNSNS